MLEMLKKYKRFLMMDMLSISWVNCKITIRIKMMQCMHFFRLVLGKIGDISIPRNAIILVLSRTSIVGEKTNSWQK